MLLTIIEILAAVGAVGFSALAGGFSSAAWLWQIPVFFAGLWLGMVLVFTAFLFIWSMFVNLNQPVEKEKKFDRVLTEQACNVALRLLHVKLHVTGMEQLPKEGRFMLVCNHLHILDPVVLINCFKGKQLAFISKRENNTLPLINKLMHKIQCQLINRENDREALKTIIKCIDLIKKDKASVMAFPEGYTSKDGVLHEFRNGVFKIAQRANVPVVVCTIKHTSQVFKNVLSFHRPHVNLDLVQVIYPQDFGATTKEMGDQVHALMEQSIGSSVG